MKETAVIIGGTSGMGLATAKLLADQGYNVIVGGRSQNKVDSAVAAIHQARGDSATASGDTLDFTDQDLTNDFFAKVGTLDHLVLVGSGSPARGRLEELVPERLVTAFTEKFLGYYHCARAALATISHAGTITIVTGGAGRASIPGTSLMAGINAGIQAWGLVLAKELAPRRVNIVSPGFIDTPLHDWQSPAAKSDLFERLKPSIPVGRVGTSKEIADAILFLIRNEYVSGAVLDVDGGIRLR